MVNFGNFVKLLHSFFCQSWKTLALVCAFVLGVLIWLLSRDGYHPKESRGLISITDSDGNELNVLSGVEENEGSR